jgi:hypothetical protein
MLVEQGRCIVMLAAMLDATHCAAVTAAAPMTSVQSLQTATVSRHARSCLPGALRTPSTHSETTFSTRAIRELHNG